MKRRLISILCLTGLALLALGAAPADQAERFWPQWRGPLANGVAPHGDPPVRWSESENVRWKVEIPGRGHASPIVWGDRVYVLSAVATERPIPGAQTEAEAVADASSEAADATRRARRPGVAPDHYLRFIVVALDRASGRVLWERSALEAVPHEGTHPDGTWASASPVTDGERVYCHFGSRGLFAYTMEGDLEWQVDLGDMTTRRGFGEGSSPALWGDTLVVNWDHEGESFLVALDKRTGAERWRVARDEVTSWSTPLVVEVDGRPQVVVSATGRVRGYDLATGAVVWESSGMTVNTIPSPVEAGGVVFVMSGFRGNALQAIRLAGARGDVSESKSVLWSYDRDTPYVPSPLLYGDSLYFLKHNQAILSQLDARTGEARFGPARLEGIEGVYASPVGASGRVYVAGRDGTTLVLGSGAKLEVLATNRLDDGFDASPAIVDGELYLRGRKHLYCIAES